MTVKINQYGINAVQDNVIEQPDLKANVAGNGPAFSVYRANSVQNITAITYVKVQLNGESFDTNGAYDSVTNFRFQPTVAGIYQFDAGALAQTASGNITSVIASLYKNGVEYYWTINNTPATGRCSGQVSGAINMNGTSDYVEFYVHVDGTAPFLNIGTRTYFSGYLARAA